MSTIRKALSQCKHPNSRKTLAITKQAKRMEKKDKHKIGQVIKTTLIGEKLLWFKANLHDLPETPLKKEQIMDLVQKYIARFDEELAEIDAKNSIGSRKNRQHASREDVIKMTKNRDMSEFKGCGLEIPDLFDAAQVNLLKSWEGEPRILQHFKMKRITMKQLS